MSEFCFDSLDKRNQWTETLKYLTAQLKNTLFSFFNISVSNMPIKISNSELISITIFMESIWCFMALACRVWF